jgi:hypothetical protein
VASSDFDKSGDLRSKLLPCIDSDLDLTGGGGNIGIRSAAVGSVASGDIGGRLELLLCMDRDLA